MVALSLSTTDLDVTLKLAESATQSHCPCHWWRHDRQSAGPSTGPWRTLLVTGFHWLLLVTAMNSAILPRHIAGSYLTNSIWEDVNNFLMGCCYNALPIDFNDSMANTHTSSLCYASSHKATDLQGRAQIYHGLDKEQTLLTTHFLPAIYESTFKQRLETTNSKMQSITDSKSKFISDK